MIDIPPNPQEQDIEAAVARVLDDHPGLCADGLYAWPLRDRQEPGQPLAKKFPESRRQLAAALDAVRQALTYLDECKSLSTFNLNCDSYGLKHRAENLHLPNSRWAPVPRLTCSHKGYWPQRYVSNGAMICACIIRGIPFRMIDGGPNCYLALQEPKPCRRANCPHWLPAGTAKRICKPCRDRVEPDSGAAPRLVQDLRSQPEGIMDCAAINSSLSRRHWETMLADHNPHRWQNGSLLRRSGKLVEPWPQFPLPPNVRVPLWPWVLAKGLGIDVKRVDRILHQAWDEFDLVRPDLPADIGQHCAQVDEWVCALVNPDLTRNAWSWRLISGSIRNESGAWSSAPNFVEINTYSGRTVTDDDSGWPASWAFGLRPSADGA